MAKGEGGVADIGVGDLAQDVAGLRAHQRQGAEVLGYVGEFHIQVFADVVPDPGEVMGAKAGAGDDVEPVIGEPCNSRGRIRCRRAY